jgi:hypothetical protein
VSRLDAQPMPGCQATFEPPKKSGRVAEIGTFILVRGSTSQEDSKVALQSQCSTLAERITQADASRSKKGKEVDSAVPPFSQLPDAPSAGSRAVCGENARSDCRTRRDQHVRPTGHTSGYGPTPAGPLLYRATPFPSKVGDGATSAHHSPPGGHPPCLDGHGHSLVRAHVRARRSSRPKAPALTPHRLRIPGPSQSRFSAQRGCCAKVSRPRSRRPQGCDCGSRR